MLLIVQLFEQRQHESFNSIRPDWRGPGVNMSSLCEGMADPYTGIRSGRQSTCRRTSASDRLQETQGLAPYARHLPIFFEFCRLHASTLQMSGRTSSCNKLCPSLQSRPSVTPWQMTSSAQAARGYLPCGLRKCEHAIWLDFQATNRTGKSGPTTNDMAHRISRKERRKTPQQVFWMIEQRRSA